MLDRVESAIHDTVAAAHLHFPGSLLCAVVCARRLAPVRNQGLCWQLFACASMQCGCCVHTHKHATSWRTRQKNMRDEHM